jgi:succinate-semialdehyde dehydrogenase/glutarate-semialdehyde dehydrogenase
MGKPISQAMAELTKCQSLCSYYADNASSFLADEEVFSQPHKAFVRKQPLGVILGVMPWNFPFWQVFRFAIPTLLAGNTVVVKHADNVQLSAEALQDCFEEAGFPKGVYTNMCIDHQQVEATLKDARVKAVSLTGSTRAGREVARIAGEQLKPSLLELGGSNALIVLPDAPLHKVVKLCIKARFQNTGQSCIAGKRLLLHTAIYADFMQLLKEEVNQLKQGDPTQKETYISCLAREDLAVELKKQLDASVNMGAKVTLGGTQEKAYVAPTIVEEVQPSMPIFNEETFGPLLAVTRFSSVEEAVQLSNLSNYGLGVSVFTVNPEPYLHLIDEFEEGAVVFNDFVKSDPSLPFGGVKDSGYGRELAKEGILAFVNIQSIQLKNF